MPSGVNGEVGLFRRSPRSDTGNQIFEHVARSPRRRITRVHRSSMCAVHARARGLCAGGEVSCTQGRCRSNGIDDEWHFTPRRVYRRRRPRRSSDGANGVENRTRLASVAVAAGTRDRPGYSYGFAARVHVVAETIRSGPGSVINVLRIIPCDEMCKRARHVRCLISPARGTSCTSDFGVRETADRYPPSETRSGPTPPISYGCSRRTPRRNVRGTDFSCCHTAAAGFLRGV